MNENNKKLLAMLPQELKELKIEERHKVLLVSKKVGAMMWTVLLTEMPGQCPSAWTMPIGEYWKIQPKHGTRERWIRENLKPTYTAPTNEKRRQLLALLL